MSNMLNKYRIYLNERFPISQTLLLSTLVSAVVSFGTQVYLFDSVQNLSYFFITVIVFFLFLLGIRLMDEFRDADDDKIHHPERPIPRGLLTLDDLKRPLLAVVVISFVIAVVNGVLAFSLFLMTFAYGFFAYKEFYIKDWLEKHFTIYIFLLELQIIPLVFYMCAINGISVEHILVPFFIWTAVFVKFTMSSIEVARKIRAPKNETTAKDTRISTYTAQYGILNAVLVLSGYIAGMLITYLILLNILTKNIFLSVVLSIILSVLFSLFAFLFISKQTEKYVKYLFLSTTIILTITLSAYSIQMLFV